MCVRPSMHASVRPVSFLPVTVWPRTTKFHTKVPLPNVYDNFSQNFLKSFTLFFGPKTPFLVFNLVNLSPSFFDLIVMKHHNMVNFHHILKLYRVHPCYPHTHLFCFSAFRLLLFFLKNEKNESSSPKTCFMIFGFWKKKFFSKIIFSIFF